MLANRERVIVIEPWHKGLIATTLRYPYELRNAEDYFDDIPNVELEPEMLQLAERILQARRRTSTHRNSWIAMRKH